MAFSLAKHFDFFLPWLFSWASSQQGKIFKKLQHSIDLSLHQG
jgi:hypothetical protein